MYDCNYIYINFIDKDDDARETISVDGMINYCAALRVDPEDVVMLVMAWNLKAEKIGEFKKEGFIEGWTKLRFLIYKSYFFFKKKAFKYFLLMIGIIGLDVIR